MPYHNCWYNGRIQHVSQRKHRRYTRVDALLVAALVIPTMRLVCMMYRDVFHYLSDRSTVVGHRTGVEKFQTPEWAVWVFKSFFKWESCRFTARVKELLAVKKSMTWTACVDYGCGLFLSRTEGVQDRGRAGNLDSQICNFGNRDYYRCTITCDEESAIYQR